MATVSDNTIEPTAASHVDDVFQNEDPKSFAAPAGDSVELTSFRTNTQVNEASVSFIIKDETSTDWKTSRYNHVLPFSTSTDSLYASVAKDAGYVAGTFDLIWRRQDPEIGEEEIKLDQHSTATLYEMGMKEEPTKTYLLIREKDEKQPERINATTTENSTGQVSNNNWSSYTNPMYNSSYTSTSNYSSSNYTTSNYGYYSSYSYNSRSDTGFVGLVNQAMTCYLNSLLQTLYMTPEFRNAIYRWKFESKVDSEDQSRSESSKCIPYQLQRLFLQLQTAKKRAVETTDVTTSFGWDSSEAWQQHDVQELCRVMFDAMEKRFKKDNQLESQVDLINELYQGMCKDYVKCKKCGHESAREDTFLDIPLVIKPFGSSVAFSSVEEALKAFVEPETLDGDNQYFCEKCNEKQDALKGLKFKRFPYLLTLQLKRFDFDYSTMHRIKLNDRMTFPKVLNLNHFIDDDEEKPFVPNDLKGKYKSFVIERFDQPDNNRPPSYSSVVSNPPSYSQISNSSSSSGNLYDDISEDKPQLAEKEEAKPTQVLDALHEGPYVYELFSIMIHSGSAIGGHYYAYIKSLKDKRWYCFNDQSVTRITQEEIEQTFGGSDRNSSRGYYSSVYSYSANAYMLMYRRVDIEKNEGFLVEQSFPEHLKKQILEEKDKEIREREKQEMEKQMCKFKLFCAHPETGKITESKLEVHQSTLLPDVVAEAHKVLKLSKYVPVEQCRLVKYDDYSETLDQSFDIDEFGDQTFGQLVGGARTYYSFELFLETRKENETFTKYNKGGMRLKILVIDLQTGEVQIPISIRAEQGWTVLELKQVIGERFDLDPNCMNIVLEIYNDGRHLSHDSSTLRSESLYRKHTLFVSSDPYDYQKPYKESLMYKCVEIHVNSIIINITLPPQPEPPPTTLPQEPIKLLPGEEVVPDLMPASNSVEAELTNGIDQNKIEEEREGKKLIEDKPVDVKKKDEDSEEEVEVKSKIPLLSKDIKILSRSEEEKGKKREVQVRVDRRTTLAQLKDRLSPIIGVPSTNFKVYRVYNNQQEYELERLNDTLMSTPTESKFVVRLGRALQAGEHRIKLYLLNINNSEFFNFMMESIISKNITIREFKKQIIEESKQQGVNHKFEIDKMRLRKKTWRSPGTIYLDHQSIDKDIYLYAGSEIYVEPLEVPEKMNLATQMQIYVRRWRPSQFVVDQTKEVILDTAHPSDLKKKLSEIDDIPVDQISIAKAVGSFPAEISCLEIENELDWNPAITSISQSPFSLYDDGGVIYYKDSRETLKELTAEEKSKIQKSESSRLNKASIYGTGSTVHSNYSYYRRETALKIYTEDDKPEKDKNE